MTNSALQKNVGTWFWRSVIWDAFNRYARRLWPHYGDDIWTSDNIRSWQRPRATELAFLYVMTSKILTGAMGALSEPGQLKIQEYAWLENSTAVMATDGPGQDLELLLKVGDINRGWLEFHSAMKDLTGLWFKGALFDVIRCEAIDRRFLDDVGRVLCDASPGGDRWSPVFQNHIAFMKSERWNRRLERARPDYVDDLEDLDTGRLESAIDTVRNGLGQALRRPETWGLYDMPPNRADRKFLHYSDQRPWEGRYDTMYSPIRYNNVSWTYLVEHRFN